MSAVDVKEPPATLDRQVAVSHAYPAASRPGPQFDRLVADWRPHLVAGEAADRG